MRYLGVVIVSLGLFFGLAPVQPVRADNCQFVLGFATIASLIPRQVGQCLENEHHSATNGDGLQATTGGLLVWRKADNFTAFTDGFRTWVNGPFGLQMRLNSQRFFWEQNPEGLPIIPTPVAGERCHTAGLRLVQTGTDAGAGNFFGTFAFTNTQAVPCTFFGFPGAGLLDAANNPLPTNVVRNGGFFPNNTVPTTVTVPPGGTAIFRMHWGQVPVGNETTCPTSAQLAVTPPDEFSPLIIPAQIMACGGGRLDVTPILPPGS
jgi:hypothetical protein